MKKYLIAAMMGILLFSCGKVDPNKQIGEGYIKDNIYKSSEIGWSIKIPNEWEVVTKDELKSDDQKGKVEIAKTSGVKFNTSKLKHLISFKKNKNNLFASTSEPFKEDYTGQYFDVNNYMDKLIFNTFSKLGIKADSSSEVDIIDSLKFNTFKIQIYNKDRKLVLTQLLYSKLINGFDFGVNINYTDDSYGNVMLKAWNESKFEKKQ